MHPQKLQFRNDRLIIMDYLKKKKKNMFKDPKQIYKSDLAGRLILLFYRGRTYSYQESCPRS